ILDPTARTTDALQRLSVPAGIDIKIKVIEK
ncbi:MAG: 30S ribosomal protein S10, partial [Planctomycetota bacterium]